MQQIVSYYQNYKNYRIPNDDLIAIISDLKIMASIERIDDMIINEYGDNIIDSGRSVMFAYVGIAIGDLVIGYVSQYFKSRKKALLAFYSLNTIAMILFFSTINSNDTRMYAICGLLGFSTGYWAIFNTMAAEQFGTNLRATAATTIPNMVRGALPLINFLFLDVLQKQLGWTIIQSGILTGTIVMTITIIAFVYTEETYHKDLDYLELDEPLP